MSLMGWVVLVSSWRCESWTELRYWLLVYLIGVVVAAVAGRGRAHRRPGGPGVPPGGEPARRGRGAGPRAGGRARQARHAGGHGAGGIQAWLIRRHRLGCAALVEGVLLLPRGVLPVADHHRHPL